MWCLEKTLESPLDCKEIQPIHPKGDRFLVFIERTDVEAKTPILWSPDMKSWLIWKDPDVGKGWRQEKKGTTEDEMFGWHHCLNGHEFGWTQEESDVQGGLTCCSPWGRKESDTTEWLKCSLSWFTLPVSLLKPLGWPGWSSGGWMTLPSPRGLSSSWRLLWAVSRSNGSISGASGSTLGLLRVHLGPSCWQG